MTNSVMKLETVEKNVNTYYLMNKLNIQVSEEVGMSKFEYSVTRGVKYETPWMFLLDRNVELDVDFLADIPTTNPSAAPSTIPTQSPNGRPTQSPTKGPSPLTMDHLFLSYAVLQTDPNGQTTVRIDYETFITSTLQSYTEQFFQT
eukprot:UN31564